MLKNLFLAFFVLFTVWSAYAAPHNMSVTMSRTSNPNNPDPGDGDERSPHRIPCMMMICTLTDGGVEVPGVDKSEILSYEIYDADGNPIAAFADETEFTDCLFNLSGQLEIRFITYQYVFSGLIDL